MDHKKTHENPLVREEPNNIVAEQMLLGTLLTHNQDLNKVNDFLVAESFFEPVHQRIFKCIQDYAEKGIIANPVTLKNLFDKDEALVERQGAKYLNELASLAATIINVHDYGKVIYNLALRRNLISIGEGIVNDAYEQEEAVSATNQIEVAEQKLYNVASDYLQKGKGFVSIKESLGEAVYKAEYAFKNKGELTGIPVGFNDLDELLGGLQNSDLVIIAARPAMGKTSIALNIALNSCKALLEDFNEKKARKPHNNPDGTEKNLKPPSIGIFSLEMSSDQLASRMISMISTISTSKIRTGHLDDEEFSSIVKASKELQDLPMFIDDTPSLSISALRTRARRLKRKHNLKVLFIDYLQLVKASYTSKDSNRVQEISEITQGLKAIAKELDIPVVALSQLSRAVEQRDNKRPLLSDLRESGSIEQDADIVGFLYREEYYLMRKKPSQEGTEEYTKWQQEMSEVSNVSEVIIAKHRNGPVGEVKLYFDPSLTRFTNLAKDR